MILHFINDSNPNRTRVIAKVKTEKEAWNEISKFLKERNYKSYYTRVWNKAFNIRRYDVGSYVEFFELELEDGEKFDRQIGEDNEQE
jgi:hypothetical protein